MASVAPGPIRPPLRPFQEPVLKPADQGSAADFIASYANHDDVLEAPREVHEAVAISLLAGVFGLVPIFDTTS